MRLSQAHLVNQGQGPSSLRLTAVLGRDRTALWDWLVTASCPLALEMPPSAFEQLISPLRPPTSHHSWASGPTSDPPLPTHPAPPLTWPEGQGPPRAEGHGPPRVKGQGPPRAESRDFSGRSRAAEPTVPSRRPTPRPRFPRAAASPDLSSSPHTCHPLAPHLPAGLSGHMHDDLSVGPFPG